MAKSPGDEPGDLSRHSKRFFETVSSKTAIREDAYLVTTGNLSGLRKETVCRHSIFAGETANCSFG